MAWICLIPFGYEIMPSSYYSFNESGAMFRLNLDPHAAKGRNAMDRRVFLKGAAAFGLGLAAYEPAFAQSFPSNVIRIVVPYSASTPPDILARIVATALSEGE